MAHVLGRHALRLGRCAEAVVGQSGCGAAAGRRFGSSSAATTSTTAGERSGIEPHSTASSPSGRAGPALSEKARGKQRARPELEAGADEVRTRSPYTPDTRMYAAFADDVQQLRRLAAADGDSAARHSARAWLQVLDKADASYSSSAPQLLDVGAFYCSPLDGPGGRSFLARLHCHLLASQIHSAADAELALKVLRRHCVFGRSRSFSLAAWPQLFPTHDGSPTSSTSVRSRREDQHVLISAFARSSHLVAETASAVLERILRDLGALHLAQDCTALVVQLSLRFRSQIGPAQPREALSRYSHSYASRAAEQSRWLRPLLPNRPRRPANTKAREFHQLILRLAHLLPHSFDRRHTRAAILLLKAIVLLSNVHTDAQSMREVSLWPSVKNLTSRWTSRWATLLRSREQDASALPRKRARQPGIFGPELCRDVARALLDAPSKAEPSWDPSRSIIAQSPQPVLRALNPTVIDTYGDCIQVDSLRSLKRRSFLTYRLAHACMLAIHASTQVRHRHWSESPEAALLLPTDFDAVIRAVVLNGLEETSLVGRASFVKSLNISARKSEARCAAWLARPQSRARLRHLSPELQKARLVRARHGIERTNYLLKLHCRIAFFSPLEPSHDRYEARAALREESRTFVHAHIYKLCMSGNAPFFEQWPEFLPQRKTARRTRAKRSKSGHLELWRHAVTAFAADSNIREDVVFSLLGCSGADTSTAGLGFWNQLLSQLRGNAAVYSSAILGFTASGRWEAVDRIWQTAAARRAFMPARSFDRVVQAYLRSQRLRSRCVPASRREEVLQHALTQVTSVLPSSTAPRQLESSPSANLAHEVVHYVGNLLSNPHAAFDFWQVMLERNPAAATQSQVLVGILGVARSFELQRNMARLRGYGPIGGDLVGDVSLGLRARRVVRQLLFSQHPALQTVTFGLPYTSVIVRTPRTEPTPALAVSSAAPSRGYIAFDQRVFEAYFELMHAMLIPNSVVGRSTGPGYAFAASESQPLNLKDGQWIDAFFGGPAGNQMPDGDDMELADDEPARDEALRILHWMRALNIKPSPSLLCFVCVHLLELYPPPNNPSKRRAQQRRKPSPAGWLRGFLEGWLGREAVPREEEVAAWLRQRRERVFAEEQLLV